MENEVSSYWLRLLHDPIRRDVILLQNTGSHVASFDKKALRTWLMWMQNVRDMISETLSVQKELYMIKENDSSGKHIVDIQQRIRDSLEMIVSKFSRHRTRFSEPLSTDQNIGGGGGGGGGGGETKEEEEQEQFAVLIEQCTTNLIDCMKRVELRVEKVIRSGCKSSLMASEDTLLQKIVCQRIASRKYRVVCYWRSVMDRPHDMYGSYAREKLVEILPVHLKWLHVNVQMKRFRKTHMQLHGEIEMLSCRVP